MSTHWGNWVRSRMVYVGFRRQMSLAQAIGCTQNQMCRWLAMETPPDRMRRGHDAALCRVLHTDAYTLFTNFVNVSPFTAPMLNAPDPSQLAPMAPIAA
jgi:hypothetical protein